MVWRYLGRSYLQVFLLCLFSLIGALFVMRFKEISEFAALSSDGAAIFLFSLYQLPYVLPDAIPISCVVASMIAIQKMSRSGEMTALRTGGFSLIKILFPILVIGFLLSLANFAICSELAPRCKGFSKDLSRRVMASNPFYIFNKIQEGKITNAYVEMRALRGGTKAKDLLLIMNNESNGRLGLVTASELAIEHDLLIGKDVSIVSSVDSKDRDNFDHLIIENQQTMSTEASNLAKLLQDTSWHLGFDYLPTKMLLSKAATKVQSIFTTSIGVELGKRISIGFAPLLFTILGTAFGFEIGRSSKRKGIFLTIALSSLYLACFVGAKALKLPLISWVLFFIPYPIILTSAFFCLWKVSKGIEA